MMICHLQRIISGGQTGVDISALRAAKAVGLKTGGHMTRTFRTLAGLHPEYAELYGMVPVASEQYQVRTYYNVLNSDATVRIAKDFMTPGEKCTLTHIRTFQRPTLSIPYSPKRMVESVNSDVNKLVKFICEREIVTLNVAGNAEEHAPGIEKWAETFLTRVFTECLKLRQK